VDFDSIPNPEFRQVGLDLFGLDFVNDAHIRIKLNW